MRPLILIAVILAAGSPAVGGIALPLGGACRVGRFFPVGVDSVDRITLQANGCLPVDVSADHQRMIAPVLVTATPGTLNAGGQTFPLHLLGDDEALVGTVDPSIDLSSLFPGKHLIAVGLDPVDPLPGPAAAWETLDAVFLDGPSMQRLGDTARSALLAAGIKVVTGGSDRPDHRWPWVRQDRWWVLTGRPMGPTAELVSSDAYSPVSAWSPGRPGWVRTDLVTGSILVSLAVAAVCLWRSRWRVVVTVAVLLLATGAVIAWRKTLDVSAAGGGDVVVVGPSLVQRDSWVFYRGVDSGTVTVPFTGWTHPIFSSATEMAAGRMRLAATPTSTAFLVPMVNDRLAAFVHREVRVEAVPEFGPSTLSTMGDLAREIYTGAGCRLVGESPAPVDRWPTAVVRTKPAGGSPPGGV